MSRRLHLLLCCILGLLVPLAHASEEQSAQVDRLFAAWDRPDSPGAALVVLRDGQVVHRRGYGLAQVEAGMPITAQTPFHVASLSKQFTAFSVHLLVQDGKLSLDDEVRKHVPELQVTGPPITLRHLMHHTSGLRDQWNLLLLAGLRLDDTITEGDIQSLLWRQRALNFNPGDEELYSNSGYTLLALIVQRVSGQRFAAFARSRVFEPLGMKNTHVHDDYGVLVPGRAYSYQRSRDGWRYVALSYSNVGATSVFTTADDLALWDRNLGDAHLGGAAVQAAMLVRGRLNSGREIGYASGLVLARYRGQGTVEHGGSDAGYRSHLLRLPDQKLSVLLLGNAADLNTGELARRVADVYLDDQLPAEAARRFPAEIAVDPKALQPLLGDFEMRPGFVLRFSAEGHQLSVQATAQPKFPLFAAAENAFFTKAFEASVTFDAPTPGGHVETAMWRQNGRDQPLRRIVREAPSAESLQDCTGEYFSDELQTLYHLSWRDGRLWLSYPRGERALEPVSKDRFSAAFPIGSIALRRNAASGCVGLSVSNGRVRDLRFQRVTIVPAS